MATETLARQIPIPTVSLEAEKLLKNLTVEWPWSCTIYVCSSEIDLTIYECVHLWIRAIGFGSRIKLLKVKSLELRSQLGEYSLDFGNILVRKTKSVRGTHILVSSKSKLTQNLEGFMTKIWPKNLPTKVSFFVQFILTQFITFQNFNIQTCFSQLWQEFWSEK